MTLLELSGEYRASAAALRERVLLLEHRLRGVDGDGRRLLELPSFKDLCEGVALEFTDIQKVGPDVRLMLRPVR